MSKIRSIITLGICIVLFSTLLFSNIILAQDGGSYNPWMDLNDDGIIDALDLQALAPIYSTSGKPINKTALLLELETRLNNLNASLLKFYYNTTECNSLFALLSHMHSGSDISGGTLRADQIKIGSSEASQIIYFYEDGWESGEFIAWHDSNDRFWVSEDTYIEGTITIPTTTRYYSIPGCAWQPIFDSYDFMSGTSTSTLTNGPTFWFAPVHLPHGAVITEIRAWLLDYNATSDIEVYLNRQQAGDQVHEMASISSSGSSAAYTPYDNSSISYSTIDNACAYYLRAILRSGNDYHRLAHVRITYTIDEPLP